MLGGKKNKNVIFFFCAILNVQLREINNLQQKMGEGG